jgi:hypothetical protein
VQPTLKQNLLNQPSQKKAEEAVESLSDAESKKSEPAQKQTLWGWGRRSHNHHRHSPHTHTPLMGGSARTTCECTGDPHCQPFHGNWFDVQHEGEARDSSDRREGARTRTVGEQVSSTWSPAHGARRKCRCAASAFASALLHPRAHVT